MAHWCKQCDRNYNGLFDLQDSELSKETAVEAQRLAAECRQQHQPLTLGSEFAASFGVQCRECTRKWFICYWWEAGAGRMCCIDLQAAEV